MDWQQFAALAIVATTLALFTRSRLRRRKFSFERDTPCGCAAASAPFGQRGSIVFRARKGARPEVCVRMK